MLLPSLLLLLSLLLFGGPDEPDGRSTMEGGSVEERVL